MIYIQSVFFDIGSAGLYKFATSLASFSVKLSIPLQQVVFPEISYLFVKKQLNKLKKILYHVINYGIIYVLIITIFIINFGDEITFLIGGEEFKHAASLLIILTLSTSIRAAGFFIRPAILIGISHKTYLKNFIFSFLFFICFIIIGIFDENLILICFAHVVFDLTHYIYGIVVLKRYSLISFKNLIYFLSDMKKPLITIGITCYNSSNTIIRAINSAIKQKWKNTEIIIIDDSSTDESFKIIKNLQKKNKK